MALNNLTRIGNSGFGTDTSINTTGIVTAASFSGDGSGLTGVTATGSGVVVQEEGSNVGTAQTINFIGTGVTATLSGGIANIEIATSGGGGGGGLSNVVEDTTPQLGGNLDLNSNNITGTGDISITGVSTFAGITTVTGETFFTKQLNASGISTFRSSVDIVNGSIKLKTPTDNDVFSISYSAANDDVSFRFDQTGGTGGSQVQFDLRDNAAFRIKNINTAGTIAKFTADGNNELYYDDSKKFETTNTGAIVTGTLVATATTATNVTVANETSDTECFVMFGVNATGDNAPKSSSSLKYNSSTGGLTAGSFIGDGSGLTGITASGSGVIVRDDGSLVGTAGTINFGANVSVSPISAGVVTVTASAGSIPGISTAQTTQLNNLTVAGVSTFNAVRIGDGGDQSTNNLFFGADNDLKIYHTGTHAFMENSTGNVYLRSVGTSINIEPAAGSAGIIANAGGDVELYYNNSKKFETSGVGVTITSQLDTTNIVASGVITATTFSGSGASLTTLNASELDSGTIPDARFPATLPAVSGTNLTNLPAPTPADTDVQVTFDVSSNGSSAYRITGPGYSGADDNPDIYLVRGQRYRFINGTGSSHPFRIQSDTSGTAYTDGVSGSQNGTQDFNVQHDAPVRLYYQCTIHSGMIGNIYIVGGSDWRMTDVATNATPEIFTNLNVGIGTDNPSLTGSSPTGLHIAGGNAALKLQNTNNGDWAFVEYADETNTTKFIQGYRDANGYYGIRPGTSLNADPGITVTSDSKIGINNQTPLYPLHFKNAMGSAPSFIHMEVTGTNTVGGGAGIQFDTSASNSGSNNGLYLATIHGERSSSDNGSNSLVFKTTKAGAAGDDGNTHSPKTRMTIDEDGDVNISDGNLVVASGHGISFAATANGGTGTPSELLDDYEEGFFTPTIYAGADNGSGGAPSFAIQAGRYIKIGRKVHCDIYFRFASGDLSTGSHARIGNLPFAMANESYGNVGASNLTRGGGVSTFQNTTNDLTSCYGNANTTYFYLYKDGGTSFIFGGSNNASLSGLYWIGIFEYICTP